MAKAVNGLVLLKVIYGYSHSRSGHSSGGTHGSRRPQTASIERESELYVYAGLFVCAKCNSTSCLSGLRYRCCTH